VSRASGPHTCDWRRARWQQLQHILSGTPRIWVLTQSYSIVSIHPNVHVLHTTPVLAPLRTLSKLIWSASAEERRRWGISRHKNRPDVPQDRVRAKFYPNPASYYNLCLSIDTCRMSWEYSLHIHTAPHPSLCLKDQRDSSASYVCTHLVTVYTFVYVRSADRRA